MEHGRMDAAATPDGRQEQRQRATAVTFTSVLEEGGRQYEEEDGT